MTIATGTHQLGPETATLQVRTFREGMASKVGHDLVIEATRWQGTITVGEGRTSVELSADPAGLAVREGVHGLKPLSDKDRDEIHNNIRKKVLGDQPITFSSTSVEPEAGGAGLVVQGDLTMNGSTRPVSARLGMTPDGSVTGTIAITQSQWGIKPYRGLMGALKVRDDIEVVVDGRLPVA